MCRIIKIRRPLGTDYFGRPGSPSVGYLPSSLVYFLGYSSPIIFCTYRRVKDVLLY